jgi:sterol desaturase/sphingolipid hydroxylase (fatty acid hydroxylase superfamily)
MRSEQSFLRSIAYAIDELCARPQTPLSVAEQRRRYRHRRGWPDWLWAMVVGLLVSAVVVVAMLHTQAK